MDKKIHITNEPLDSSTVISHVTEMSAGAVNVFIGRVRNITHGKKVVRLEYEAYESMAKSEIEKIITNAKKQWEDAEIAVHHRTGILLPGEIAVIIAVCTPHRKASFEACEYMINTLKDCVPIWKKEVFEDGETWVSAHP